MALSTIHHPTDPANTPTRTIETAGPSGGSGPITTPTAPTSSTEQHRVEAVEGGRGDVVSKHGPRVRSRASARAPSQNTPGEEQHQPRRDGAHGWAAAGQKRLSLLHPE